MNTRNYQARLKEHILHLGVQVKQDLNEQCRVERRDVSKHEYVQVLEERALEYLREVSTQVNDSYWKARNIVDDRKSDRNKQMLALTMMETTRDKQAVIRDLRRQVCENTRKTLRQPDRLQEAVKVVYVREPQNYGPGQVQALKEMAYEFGVDVNF